MNMKTIINRLEDNDLRIYDDYRSTAEQAELNRDVHWIIPQKLTASKNEQTHRNRILMFDGACNPGWASFYKHPELQCKLLTLVADGRTTGTFYPPVHDAKVENLYAFLLSLYEDIKIADVPIWCRDTSIEALIDLMDMEGLSEKQQDAICKQYKSLK